MIEYFITLAAWIFGAINIIIIFFKIIGAATYSELDKLRDDIAGITRSWPIDRNVIVLIICICWLVVYYFYA